MFIDDSLNFLFKVRKYCAMLSEADVVTNRYSRLSLANFQPKRHLAFGEEERTNSDYSCGSDIAS